MISGDKNCSTSSLIATPPTLNAAMFRDVHCVTLRNTWRDLAVKKL